MSASTSVTSKCPKCRLLTLICICDLPKLAEEDPWVVKRREARATLKEEMAKMRERNAGYFQARYAGHCLHCGEPIRPGQWVAHSEAGPVCCRTCIELEREDV